MIAIPCPRCGKMRDYSHLPDVIEGNWQSLLPILVASPCQACVKDAILNGMLASVDAPIPVRWQTPLRRRR